jgi:hypothetical protein
MRHEETKEARCTCGHLLEQHEEGKSCVALNTFNSSSEGTPYNLKMLGTVCKCLEFSISPKK